MDLSPERKIAGVLAPLFALRTENDLGVGDLEALRQFIDWAAEIGFKLVQLLPINEMGGDHSPYNAISAVAIEPTTLYLAPGTPAELTQEDFDEVVREFDLERLRHGPVKYTRVRKLKMALLERAYQRFAQNGESQEAFDAFCQTEAPWLNDYSFFRALMATKRGIAGGRNIGAWNQRANGCDRSRRKSGRNSKSARDFTATSNGLPSSSGARSDRTRRSGALR